MNRYLLKIALLVSLCVAAPAKADLAISIGSLSLPELGTGFLDVMISGDAADVLDIFQGEFEITTTSGRLLTFTAPFNTQVGKRDYVFGTDSVDAMFPPLADGEEEDYYIGGDGTLSGEGVVVTGNKLLARFAVTADTDNRPVSGDVFTLSLKADDSTFFLNPELEEIDFTSSPGTITITGAAVGVPEPGSLILFGLGGLGLLGYAWQRKGAVR